MISVVIVNWNTKTFLEKCLESLAEDRDRIEVIVVDNASKDGSAQMVSDRFPWVRLLAEGANHGYAKGNNLGFRASTGDFILTLNSDTVVPTGVIAETAARIASDPKVGVGAVRLVEPSGRTQKSVRGWPTVIGIAGDILGLSRLRPGSVWDSYRFNGFDYDKTQDAPQPMGTYLLIKKEALQSLDHPEFDEQFPIFFNEVDLLYRLQQQGWSCRYFADLSITHYGGESTKQVKKPMVWESHRSLYRYLYKHTKGAARLALPLLWMVITVGAFVRARGWSAGFRP